MPRKVDRHRLAEALRNDGRKKLVQSSYKNERRERQPGVWQALVEEGLRLIDVPSP
jgi:hypothetical protein